MAKQKIRLSGTDRANIFSALNAYHDAAVDLSRLDTIDTCPPNVSRDIVKSIKMGRTLSEAGRRAGLFNQTEEMLISVGETSSKMSTIYTWMTRWYEDNVKFASLIKGKSVYPLATLSVAFIAAPLPELLNAQLSPAHYTITLFIQLSVVWGLFLRITNKLAYRQIEYFNEPWFTSILLGSEKTFARKVYERNYLKLLWLLLSAGLDAQRSVETLSGITRNRQWKRMHLAAIAAIREGNSLHQTMDQSGLLQRRDNLQVLATEEQSGTLTKSLSHHLNLLDEYISLGFTVAATWIGRAIYFGVMVFAGVLYFA